MASHVLKRIELGFVEKEDEHLLESWNFPSKIGGNPAWLSLKPLPHPDQLICQKCGRPLVFLLQVYSPDNDVINAFHRTLFLFICRDPGCCSLNSSQNVRIFRSQLPRCNEYYSTEPPDVKPQTGQDMPNASKHVPICCICGAWGTKRCGRCKRRNYCGEEHQKVDWKHKHKKECNNAHIDCVYSDSQPPDVLFKEFELVTEPEEYEEAPEKTESEKTKEYKEYLKTVKPNSLHSSKNKDLDSMAKSESESDKYFLKFKERISADPDQVLRYQRGGMPLWITNTNIPEQSDIPDCNCGAKRTFEFQVLPQLLTHLEVDKLENSIDWGVICVYTCSASCEIGLEYQEEFVWKQDIAEKN